jgi:hypothetical protein
MPRDVKGFSLIAREYFALALSVFVVWETYSVPKVRLDESRMTASSGSTSTRCVVPLNRRIGPFERHIIMMQAKYALQLLE